MAGAIIGFAILLTFVWIIVYNTYSVMRTIFNYFFEDVVNRNLFFIRLDPVYKKILEEKFSYYNKLGPRNKKIFERRVQKFINMKEYIPRGELQLVTVEMEALIAASAIQITFGLPSIYLTQFEKILIYPAAYYSTITDDYHRGEVNTRGFIVLSWNNFLQGYLDDTDGRNLGLHEMAHALKIADAMGQEESDFFDRDMFHRFVYYARLEMQKIVDGDESLFRAYAATNDQEFFAVAVENFFERPQHFFKHAPDLFNALASLLNQNTLFISHSK